MNAVSSEYGHSAWRRFFTRLCFFALLLGGGISSLCAQNAQAYSIYKGKVYNLQTEEPIAGVHLTVSGTAITGVTNKEGVFVLKIPKNQLKGAAVHFSKLGYQQSSVLLTDMANKFTKVLLAPAAKELEMVTLYGEGDPKKLVRKALNKPQKREAYLTGFYREKIRRGRRNVMLAAAVLQIDQDKWIGGQDGEIELYKSRKHTDYKRLDTIAVKLRGGPYTGLYLDLARYPQYLFYKYKSLDAFAFSYKDPTTIDGRYIFVVHFAQKERDIPWYHGTLYIDAETGSLVKANYSLNVDNRQMARKLLVVQKPKHAIVTPLETNYEVSYVFKDGQWYFSYSHFYLKIRVNWKHRLFNGRYYINSALVVTDRSIPPPFTKKDLTKIRPSIIMGDNVSGFKDPDFWGNNNIIAPDESLQEAIKTIREKIRSRK